MLGIALIALVVAGRPFWLFPGACHVRWRIHARPDASYDRLAFAVLNAVLPPSAGSGVPA
jgi:hypothetical protein